MILLMDPAVLAAIVGVPSASLAAAVAYLVGRAQARSVYRGPIDAVRRQHRRDAYAELARVGWSYLSQTGGVERLVEQVHGARLRLDQMEEGVILIPSVVRPENVRRDVLAAAFAPDRTPMKIHNAWGVLELFSPSWRQDIRDISDPNRLDDLVHAQVVVTLEGPDQLAELAEQVRLQAVAVQQCWFIAASAPFIAIPDDRPGLDVSPRELRAGLKEAIEEFTRAARVHLNAY